MKQVTTLRIDLLGTKQGASMGKAKEYKCGRGDEQEQEQGHGLGRGDGGSMEAEDRTTGPQDHRTTGPVGHARDPSVHVHRTRTGGSAIDDARFETRGKAL